MNAFISPVPVRSPARRPRHSPSRSPITRASASPSAAPAPPTPTPTTACGFAALVGPSNSGKSTLLNRLIGQKLSIVTPKPNTTRCRVAGIAQYDKTQVVYLDTPGIFEPSTRLSRAMVKSAWTSASAADAVAVVLDAAAMFHNARRAGMGGKLAVPADAEQVLKRVADRKMKGHSAGVWVCANKMDAVPEDDRDFVRERMEVVMSGTGMQEAGAKLWLMSARYGDGVEELAEWVTGCMPKGPWLYPEEDLTDMPARLLAAEVTREKAFMVLRQELPYEIAVETNSYKELSDGSIRIEQDVLVARKSQRMIVTGKGGAVVKEIGTRARKELGEILGTTVHLMLRVKVGSKWKEDKRHYEQWGLDYGA